MTIDYGYMGHFPIVNGGKHIPVPMSHGETREFSRVYEKGGENRPLLLEAVTNPDDGNLIWADKCGNTYGPGSGDCPHIA